MTTIRQSGSNDVAAHAPPAEAKNGSGGSAAPWTIDDARVLYNIEGWGIGYFDINDKGHVVVRPDRARPEHELDLFELARDLEEQGVTLPVLLRFSEILRSRIEQLSSRFSEAIREYSYD